MTRHDTLIVKETHRGLLYQDGILREVLPAGRHRVPRPASRIGRFFGAKPAQIEVILIDIRSRDRTILVSDLLTADGATISASFVLQYRVVDPARAVQQVKNYEERLYSEAQTGARRALRALTLEEVMGSRDELGEELYRMVGESARAYGLEVSSLDFKDLILPLEFRQALNRAAYSKRFGTSEPSSRDSLESDLEPPLRSADDRSSDSDEARLVVGRRTADRGSDSSEESLPLRPLGFEDLEDTSPLGNFERSRR